MQSQCTQTQEHSHFKLRGKSAAVCIDEKQIPQHAGHFQRENRVWRAPRVFPVKD